MEPEALKQQTQKAALTSITVYLALGSNLGERKQNLILALQKLGEKIEIQKISSIYETEPVGYLDQPCFFNMVCQGQTSLSAFDLLDYTKKIETEMGRQPTFRNGPRPIDIDIILYGAQSIQSGTLTVPHPRMAERAFVLVPLAEIAPQALHPVTHQTATELLKRVPQQGIQRIIEDNREDIQGQAGKKGE